MGKLICYALGVKTLEIIDQKTVKIADHPACYCRIKHHQHIIAKQCSVAMQMPFALLRLQCLIAADHAFAAGTSDRKLHA